MITRFCCAAVLAGALALAAHAATDLPWVVALDGAVGASPRVVLVLEAGPADALASAAWLSTTDSASVPADVTKLRRTATSLKGDVTLTRPGAAPVACAYHLDATLADGALTGRFTGTEGEAKVEGTLRWGADALPYGHRLFAPSAAHPVSFRGDGTGIFPGSRMPKDFALDEVAGKGVLWKTALPNWGHGTPLVLGDRVFVTCEPDTMVCLDANTGKVLWQDPAGPVTYAPVGPVVAKSSTSGWAIYAGSAYAWPCSDGRLVFRVSGDSVAAYERDGRKVWQMRFVKSGGKGADSLPWDKAIGNWGQKTEAGGWVWAGGFGIKGHTSPLVCGKLLVYACQGGLLALDASTGARAWGPVREAHTSGYYDDTPLALTIGGRAVIVTSTGGVVDAVTGAFLGDAMPLQTPKEGGKGPYSPRWEKEPTDKYTLLGSSQGWFETAPVPTGREGVVVFGKLLWCAYDKAGKPLSASAPQMTAKDQMGGAGYRALPVRIGFDADGKLTSQPLWPEPVTVPYAEQGPHMTCAQDSLFITGPTLGRTYVVDMETGKVVHQANLVDTKTIPKKPDFADPKEQAALLRFGMTEQTVMDGGDGLFRMNQAAYARTFVDGDGRLWLSDRFGHFITMDTKAPWTVTRVGAVDHPKSWLSHATLVPVGDRLYYRSFGEMYCLGAK